MGEQHVGNFRGQSATDGAHLTGWRTDLGGERARGSLVRPGSGRLGGQCARVPVASNLGLSATGSLRAPLAATHPDA